MLEVAILIIVVKAFICVAIWAFASLGNALLGSLPRIGWPECMREHVERNRDIAHRRAMERIRVAARIRD